MKLETIIKNLTEAYESGYRIKLENDIIGINDILEAKDVHEKTFQKWKANLIAWAKVLEERCWNDRLLLETNLKPLGYEVLLIDEFEEDAVEKDYRKFYGSTLLFYRGTLKIRKITQSEYNQRVVDNITSFEIGFKTETIDGKAYPTGIIYRCCGLNRESLEEAIKLVKPIIKSHYVNN